MLSAPPPQPGHRYGRLTALHAIEFRTGWRTLWMCRCECGKDRVVSEHSLRYGNTKSCGCYAKLNRQNFVIRITATRTEVYLGLLDALESVLTRHPETPREIKAALVNQWGKCDDRRFWRALRALVDQGRAIRHGRAQTTETTYTRAIPWRRNLSNCLADAAAAVAVYELGYRRAA